MSASSDVKNNFQTHSPIEGEIFSKEKMISQVNGHLWRCVDYVDGIYTFALRDEFNPKKHPDAIERMNQVLASLSLALEPTPKRVLVKYNFSHFKKTIFINFIANSIYHSVCNLVESARNKPTDSKFFRDWIQELISKYGSEELGKEISSIDPVLESTKFDQAITKFYQKLKADFYSVDDSLTRQQYEFFSYLGFSAENRDQEVIFTTPSITELQKRWGEQKFENLKLPELIVQSGKDGEGDSKFVLELTSNKLTVSPNAKSVCNYTLLHDVILSIFENAQKNQTCQIDPLEQAEKVTQMALTSEKPIISDLPKKKLSVTVELIINVALPR